MAQDMSQTSLYKLGVVVDMTIRQETKNELKMVEFFGAKLKFY